MKALVVYDSVNGNTRTIAEAVALSIGKDVKAVGVDHIDLSQAKGLDLLVVGSPTHGGRPTEAIAGFVESISSALPTGARVAAFDTRLRTRLVRVFGFAADRIAAALTAKGAQTAASEGFFVKSRVGPLVDGEVQRAAVWGRQLGQELADGAAAKPAKRALR